MSLYVFVYTYLCMSLYAGTSHDPPSTHKLPNEAFSFVSSHPQTRMHARTHVCRGQEHMGDQHALRTHHVLRAETKLINYKPACHAGTNQTSLQLNETRDETRRNERRNETNQHTCMSCASQTLGVPNAAKGSNSSSSVTQGWL